MYGQRLVGRDYPSIIKQILAEYSQIKPAGGEVSAVRNPFSPRKRVSGENGDLK